jgi:hypothetical protein
LDLLHGDACSAKSFEVLPLIFSTDCSPINWLQSVLKIRRFDPFFILFRFFLKIRRHVRGGEIRLVWCLGKKLLLKIRPFAGRIILYSQPFGRIATFLGIGFLPHVRDML